MVHFNRKQVIYDVMFKMDIITKIKKWWDGEYVAAKNNPGDSVIFIGGSYERHWSSRFAHTLFEFWIKHWKVLLPIIAGAFVALFIHFDSKTTSKSKQEKTNSISKEVFHNKSPQSTEDRSLKLSKELKQNNN